jgi:hypothetical protein
VIEPIFGDVAIDPGVSGNVGKAKNKEEPQSHAGDGQQQEEQPIAPHQCDEFYHEEESLV